MQDKDSTIDSEKCLVVMESSDSYIIGIGYKEFKLKMNSK
jgi:hypothetical protein